MQTAEQKSTENEQKDKQNKVYNTSLIRFTNKVDKTDYGCWIWQADTNPKTNYGQFWFEGRTQLAHRVSWKLYRGEIPEGLLVLHTCHIKNCVNPDHLYLGTKKDNARDAKEQGVLGRYYRNRTHCSKGHCYDEVGFYLGVNGQRRCKPCHLNWSNIARLKRLEKYPNQKQKKKTTSVSQKSIGWLPPKKN